MLLNFAYSQTRLIQFPEDRHKQLSWSFCLEDLLEIITSFQHWPWSDLAYTFKPFLTVITSFNKKERHQIWPGKTSGTSAKFKKIFIHRRFMHSSYDQINKANYEQ